MTRVELSGRAALLAAVVALCNGLTGCGGEDVGTSSQTATASAGTFPIDRAPTNPATMEIKGSPQTATTVGTAYTFQPTVVSSSGASRQFSIANMPSWAKFAAATGMLSGTPSANQSGTYAGITISVADGRSTATLPAFSIVVSATSPSNVALTWQPPTENADGTPLTDLRGYKVHYGSASKNYSDTIQISNPGLTTYVVQNLDAGKYYFAVTTYNAAGQESSLSPEILTQVD